MTETADILAMPRRAYSYSRVSDTKQARAGKDGLRRQDDFAAQICAEEGWCLDDTLVFVDKGKSGFHGEHLVGTAALAQFLEAVKEGVRVTPGSVLIIENIDRLSRQEVDVAYDIFRGLIKAGIWIATKTPRRIYRKESNSFMDLMEPIWLMYLAHMESVKKSDRIKEKWMTRRKEARATRKPHGDRCRAWLRMGPNGYEPIAERAHTIRTIHRLSQEGLGVSRIVVWLNKHRKEHPPFGRCDCWLPPFVRQLLRGRAVLGEYQPRVGRELRKEGEPIQGYYPAVISEDEWQLTQAAMDGRRRKTGRPGKREANLFTGLVREAVTGLPMSVDGRSSGLRNGQGITHRYLIAYQKGPSCRAGRGMPYGDFEAGILRAIEELQLRDVLPRDAAVTALDKRIKELTARHVALHARGEKIQSQIADPDNEDIMEDLTKSLKQVRAEEKEIAKQLKALKQQSLTGRGEALAEAQSIIQLLAEKEGTDEEEPLRRRLKASLRWLVEEIWLRVQPIGQRAYVGHAQIYLRSGVRSYVQLFPTRRPPKHLPHLWDLADADFRAGDIGSVTDPALPAS